MPYNPYVGGGCRRFGLRILILALILVGVMVVLSVWIHQQLNSTPEAWQQRQITRQATPITQREQQATQFFNRLLRELTALTPGEREQFLGEQTPSDPPQATQPRTAHTTPKDPQNLSISRVQVDTNDDANTRQPLYDRDGVRLSAAARAKMEDGIRVSSAAQTLARARRREIAGLAQQLTRFRNQREQTHQAETPTAPPIVNVNLEPAQENEREPEPETIEIQLALDDLNDWLELELPNWLANQNLPMPEGVEQIVFSHSKGMPMLMLKVAYGNRSWVISLLFDLDFPGDGSAMMYVHRVRIGQLNVPITWLMQRNGWPLTQLIDMERLQFLTGSFHGKDFEPILRVDAERGRRLIDYELHRNQLRLIFAPADPDDSPLPELRR